MYIYWESPTYHHRCIIIMPTRVHSCSKNKGLYKGLKHSYNWRRLLRESSEGGGGCIYFQTCNPCRIMNFWSTRMAGINLPNLNFDVKKISSNTFFEKKCLKRGSVSISYPFFCTKKKEITFSVISPSSVIRLGSNFTGNPGKRFPFVF
mgnify:CR=1 FL=1